MDAQLGDYNNGDLDIEQYDVLDISSVQIQHQFISEGRPNVDVFHEEYFDPSIDQDYNDDDYIQKSKNITYNL